MRLVTFTFSHHCFRQPTVCHGFGFDNDVKAFLEELFDFFDLLPDFSSKSGSSLPNFQGVVFQVVNILYFASRYFKVVFRDFLNCQPVFSKLSTVNSY